jgi:hypothetical protein
LFLHLLTYVYIVYATSIEFLGRVIRKEKAIKRIQIRKEEVKLFLFANNMILYLKDPEDFTRNVKNTFSKVARFKISIQKTVVFP